jgi:hypothetical protein
VKEHFSLIYEVPRQNSNHKFRTFHFAMRSPHQFRFQISKPASNHDIPQQLLDEIVDFGYPQNTSPEMLKTCAAAFSRCIMHSFLSPTATSSSSSASASSSSSAFSSSSFPISYILQEQLDIAKLLGVSGVKQQTTSVAPAVTGAVSWRKEGLKYKKNEVSPTTKRFSFIGKCNILCMCFSTWWRASMRSSATRFRHRHSHAACLFFHVHLHMLLPARLTVCPSDSAAGRHPAQ